ncbi:hypothetical protein AB0F49_27945 [Micromonospora ureilytica]
MARPAELAGKVGFDQVTVLALALRFHGKVERPVRRGPDSGAKS